MIKKIINKFQGLYIIFLFNSLYKKNVKNNGNFKVSGYVNFFFHKNSRIELGKNVSLNSNNYKYHLNMFSSVKLLADRAKSRIYIGDNTRINGACLHSYECIRIGKNCLIAANTQIFDGSGHDLSFEDVGNRIHTKGSIKPVFIEDNVWIGANCIIMPGVTIGYGSVIAAGSVVVKSIPKMSLAGGNPAKVLKTYE